MYPTDYLYSREHEWVRVEDDLCVIGITEFAQQELGEVVFVELPEIGQVFDANDELGTIESVKAVAEVYTPVAGEVVEVNDTVVDDPELLNEDPHGEGWLGPLMEVLSETFPVRATGIAWLLFLNAGLALAGSEPDLIRVGAWQGEVEQDVRIFPTTALVLGRQANTFTGEMRCRIGREVGHFSFRGVTAGRFLAYVTGRVSGPITYPGLYIGEV